MSPLDGPSADFKEARLKVLFVSAEVEPFAKVGGLADVVGSLPRALCSFGHDVRVVMPGYPFARERAGESLREVAHFECGLRSDGVLEPATVYETTVSGVPVWMVAAERFAGVQSSQDVYGLGRDDYLWFSRAVLDGCFDLFKPHIIHCHDWHTGFVPVLAREQGYVGPETAFCFTIHNLAYQGEFPADTLKACGLPESLFDMNHVEAYGSVNFLKAACTYSEMTNTVSPTYAREIQTPAYGCRLEGLMRHLAGERRLEGILNGIDPHDFDPASDREIAANFTADNLYGKSECKRALVEEAGLDDPKRPLLGFVGRLSRQKGIDLILESLDHLLEQSFSVVAVGVGEPELAAQLRAAANANPGRMTFFERFDETLAKRVYSGADGFLMPSAFEPCGLGQMIALRYGTVPVVRSTGGLADTIQDGLNGFAFLEPSAENLERACGRLLEVYSQPEAWRGLQRRGMACEFGWARSARQYEALYRRAALLASERMRAAG